MNTDARWGFHVIGFLYCSRIALYTGVLRVRRGHRVHTVAVCIHTLPVLRSESPKREARESRSRVSS